jgi:hypothetical protein
MPFEVINSNKNDEYVAAYGFPVGTTHHESLPPGVVSILEKVPGVEIKEIDKMPEPEKKSEALASDSSVPPTEVNGTEATETEETPEASKTDPSDTTETEKGTETDPPELAEIQALSFEKAKEKIIGIRDLSLLGLIAAKANTKGKREFADERAKELASK